MPSSTASRSLLLLCLDNKRPVKRGFLTVVNMDSLEDSVFFLIEEKLEKYMTPNRNCNRLCYRYEHLTIIKLE